MPRRKLLIGLTAAGALSAGFGAAVLPASAEQRAVTVTLLGGKTITVTLDVPAGTPLDQITLPKISTPIIGIADGGKPVAPSEPVPAQPVVARRPVHKARRKVHRQVVVKGRALVPENVRPGARPKSTRLGRAVVTPTPANPTFSFALPGPAPIGVPNFFIDKFRIPPFLLPIYQAAGIQYGVRWEVLAAINEIETDYGRNVNVSSAGAVGWMQFMPSTWKRYGTDANGDHRRDPYNPVDAIFSAARYLKAAGADQDLARAVFAYNHADWYVQSVLLRAKVIGGMPADLVGSLTGLTEGRFPVAAVARYADEHGHGVHIFTRPGAPVVAVQDAKVIHLGRHTVVLRDAYGNTYTYAHLSSLARASSALPGLPRKERLFAHPERAPLPTPRTRRVGAAHRPIARGAKITAGTVLGRTARVLRFEIRPAGRGAPRIDPKPILDGWKLLESTAIYRAAGKNPLLGRDPTIGQVMLMSKTQLQRRVLTDPRVQIYPCGREDIRHGIIDRRILATLEFLSASGLKPTVSALRCGHGYLTASGNVSEHSFGDAVDIAKINGIPILGHQGPGSITDLTIRRLLTLQGAMTPHQIISLMTYPGAPNTLALADHADHIHVGYRPNAGHRFDAILKPGQWVKLIDRLRRIANPVVAQVRP